MRGCNNFWDGDRTVFAAVRHYHRNRERKIAYAKEYQARIKAEAKHILSGEQLVCRRCGFTDERVLHIDHIHGGGHKERQHKSAQMIRDWIVKNPEEARKKYQLLCANCNYRLLCANCNYIKALEEKEYRRGPRCVKETPSHNHVEAV